MSGEPSNMRRIRSQFQKENLMLSQASSLPSERFDKLPVRCYMMVRIDPQPCSEKYQLDHITLPQERSNTCNIPSPMYHHIGRRWRGSHAQSHDTSAHKDYHTASLHHRDAGCRNIFTIFLFKKKFSLDMKA